MENRGVIAALGDAAERLINEERQFRSLADRAPFMIWRSDPHRRCDYFNRAWLEFTGRALKDELGLGWTRGLGPADYQRCLDIFQASLVGRIPFTMDYHLRRHDGEYRWILSNGVPYVRGAAVAGFLGSCVDISEHGSDDEASDLDADRRQATVRELNHRVKNSLQTTLCFSAFSMSMADEQAQDELSKVTERLSLLALVHEEVSRSGDGAAVNLGESGSSGGVSPRRAPKAERHAHRVKRNGAAQQNARHRDWNDRGRTTHDGADATLPGTASGDHPSGFQAAA